MNNIYRQVSEELGIPIQDVKRAYESYFMYIRYIISNLDLNNLDNNKVNFNIPSLGKLYFNENKFNKLKKC